MSIFNRISCLSMADTIPLQLGIAVRPGASSFASFCLITPQRHPARRQRSRDETDVLLCLLFSHT